MNAEDVLGAWTLARFVVTYDDGRPQLFPLGDDAQGMLVYTPDGHMSAVLSRASRPSLGMARIEATPRVSDAQKAEAFSSYVSYAGRYRVEGDRVVHEVTLALSPDVVGKENVRYAKLDGDTLDLTYDVTPPSGNTRHYRLTWRRL